MRTLIIAAHADDEALGCGGTIKKLTRSGHDVSILFICDGVTSRQSEVSLEELAQRKEMAQQASEILGTQQPTFLNFPDNQLDSIKILDIVKEIEVFIQDYQPQTIYTHHHGDLNIDHSQVARAVMTACRPQPGYSVKSIYGYEVASSTEWTFADSSHAFIPQRFVSLDKECIDAKLKALKAYDFEMRDFPHSRSYEALTALAKWRGATVGTDTAEAFTILREID